VLLGKVVVDLHAVKDRGVHLLQAPKHLLPVPDLPVEPLHLVVVVAVALSRQVDVPYVVGLLAEHLRAGLGVCLKPVGDEALRRLPACPSTATG